MRGAGAPVSKQRIFDRVWGFDTDVGSNVVEVYIRYLRRKIDEPFGVRTIINQRGVGYRIVGETK